MPTPIYRGRLAPSPTGLLHLGHARTFWIAAQRALLNSGTLVLRNEDLDPQRSRPEFASAMIEDLRWLGIAWAEGPDCGGPHGPYTQSARREHYLAAWRKLRDGGFLYPCSCSRKDLAQAANHSRPNDHADGGDREEQSERNEREGEDDADDSEGEPLYPGTCRGRHTDAKLAEPGGVNWRFRIPDGEAIGFVDLNLGHKRYVAGRDFGDFLVWRRDGVPSYQLAVVVDDSAMRITEVVRGADLLKSTARQILLQRALDCAPEQYFHCQLVRDAEGVRLAKRHDAMSIRQLREKGMSVAQVREMAFR